MIVALQGCNISRSLSFFRSVISPASIRKIVIKTPDITQRILNDIDLLIFMTKFLFLITHLFFNAQCRSWGAMVCAASVGEDKL